MSENLKNANDKHQYIFIYTTFPTKKSVFKVSEKMIQKKIVVCANIRKHTSVYSWNKRVYNEKEYGVYFKTRDDKWKEVEKFITEKHPYETPVIVKINIDEFNPEFKKWIDGSLD